VKRREFIAVLGSIAASSLVARAQQPLLVIGHLSVGSPESDNIAGRLGAFRRGLDEAGYVEGQNVAIEYRWAEGQHDRLPALAADLVRRQVTVIATLGGAPPALAAKTATTTIPIVFIVGIDPVQFGLVASLNRPGGNITGVAVLTIELAAKRLELLRELLPPAAVVALLVNPTNPFIEPEARNLRDAAGILGLQIHVLEASTASEIEAAFGTLVELRVAALVVSGDPFFTGQRDQISSLAARHMVPSIYAYRQFAEVGGLMSYGPNLADGYRLQGTYVGRILKGAKPADLPVQQEAKVGLVINLKTANALGLTMPPFLLARADEVIE
jgi:putative tryptophan/tyrosine transport system substrate-binding protein